MISKLLLVLSIVAWCECVYIYSSFYAPLVDPRLLGYRIDARFDEESGPRAREAYQRMYGTRGRDLIEHLGNGRGPGQLQRDNTVYSDVRLYYTYPGAGARANNNQLQ